MLSRCCDDFLDPTCSIAPAVSTSVPPPVRPGDTITFTGNITAISREANGSRVSVDIMVQNQNGNTTGAGSGSAVVPNAYLPVED